MGYNSSAKPSCLFTFLGILTFGLFLGEAVIQFYFSRVLDIIDEDVEKEKLLFNMQPADVALAGAIIHALLAICFGLWAWLLEDCLKHNSDCQRGSCAVVLFSIVIVLIHAASTFATNIYSIAMGNEDKYGYVALGLGSVALFTKVVYVGLKMNGYSCGCGVIV